MAAASLSCKPAWRRSSAATLSTDQRTWLSAFFWLNCGQQQGAAGAEGVCRRVSARGRVCTQWLNTGVVCDKSEAFTSVYYTLVGLQVAR
jgi:hypothetical protein